MLTHTSAKILGTGMYIPEKIVHNKDLEKLMDTSDEWIQQRSGIIERHYTEEGTGPSDLALRAAQQALTAAELKPQDLDLIIVATLSSDYYFPGTSVFLQNYLGLETTPAVDIKAQCTGFLYGLDMARAYISSGIYKKILLCGTEVHSSALNLSTAGRDIAVLFGDGAGAVILGPSDQTYSGIIDIKLHSQGEFRDKLKIECPSTRRKPYIDHNAIEQGLHYPVMDGRFVFKHAVKRLTEVVTDILQRQNLTASDIDLFVFHQANLRINEVVLEQLGVPLSKSYNTIMRYGNCSAASIPIGLDECVRKGILKPGQLVCLAAFGAGFTWGSAVIRW